VPPDRGSGSRSYHQRVHGLVEHERNGRQSHGQALFLSAFEVAQIVQRQAGLGGEITLAEASTLAIEADRVGASLVSEIGNVVLRKIVGYRRPDLQLHLCPVTNGRREVHGSVTPPLCRQPIAGPNDSHRGPWLAGKRGGVAAPAGAG
jgi:hypothetical protein